MRQSNSLHAALSSIGLLAWMLYILGCSGWSSWSPDGSRVLFPYFDPEAKEAGVAVFDREDASVRVIFVESPADSPSSAVLLAQWEGDGRRALIVKRVTNDSLEVIALPVGSGRPARHFKLPGMKDDFPVPPYPELDANLYLAGDYLARLNLETGGQTVQELTSPLASLATHSGRLFYLGPVGVAPNNQQPADAQEREEEKGEETQESEEDEREVEVGEVNPVDLTLRPLFRIKAKELQDPGVEDWPRPMAFDPTGARLALIGRREAKDVLILCTLAGVERILTPDFPLEEFHLGNAQWSPDGKTIYVSVLAPAAGESMMQYYVGEIPLAGGPSRLTPVVPVGEKALRNGTMLQLQVSLSPDGATLATTTAYLGKEGLGADARALYLVDVRDPARPVKRIPAPLKPPPPEPVEAKE